MFPSPGSDELSIILRYRMLVGQRGFDVVQSGVHAVQ